ncbi:EAL domain-containing protein [Denitratisoma oestradiolicum]|uniref:Uncharacterized protein n=1 Tax=Denitratisoma oestradiolicum TaxID=311182 RepID=A0A6S6XRT5_9PROT|nr:EAL domain-containing protein [Denitratisoma oestradiolicum]TWO80850.1 hypothetical protein CBW56_06745 [Denitratisoma oestradiolicum]CAB1367400.1 protein of unknown function [Denitratisoma oestradiolicum]
MQTQWKHWSALYPACWQTLWDRGGDFLWLLEPDGRVVDGNPAAAGLMAGMPVADALFWTLPCWLGARFSGSPHYRLQQASQGEVGELEVLFGSDPDERRIQLSLLPVPDAAGAIPFLLVVGRELPRHRGKEEGSSRLSLDICLENTGPVVLADSLYQAMTRARCDASLLAVCHLDIDGLRAVRESLGKRVGTPLLLAAAQRLREVLRGGDTVVRRGDDEFVLLVGDLCQLGELDRVMERVLDILAQPFDIDGHCIQLSAAVGVTIYPDDDNSDGETLLRHAGEAMAAARERGYNSYRLFDTAHTRQPRRQASARLREALAAQEFELHYQPKVCLRSGRVVGTEALLRWRHPERGLLLPGEFMTIIEDAGLCVEVGKWVIENALAQADVWRRAGTDLAVSVNVSSRQLQDAQFIPHLTDVLKAFPQLPNGVLELEIVESAALHDIQRVGEIIEQCRQLGVSFALDDFGTGYSSLAYLKRLPARTLKIDQSFIVDLLRNSEDVAIVESIIGLTQAFRRQVVAEGVETRELGAMVLRLGCDVAQGYGIARPMRGELMPDWVRAYRPDPSWVSAGTAHRDS